MSIEKRLDKGGSRADRAYFRVRDLIALRHEDVADDEVETFLAELDVNGREETPTRELTVVEQIARLENKLDRVLSLLDPGFPRPLDETDRRPLEISGSGVRYPWPQSVEPGRLLRLQFDLPGSPDRKVRCIGRVISCREPDLPHRSYSLAVAFEHIREADRDAIVRHTLEVERLAQRAREIDESGQ
ncbi:MAG: PilZ domain-containing protein [Myxococcota bacterium]